MSQQLFEIDLSSWSPVELVIFSLTYPLWIIAYILMIRRAHKDKHYAAPLVAASVMFSFEFCFIFVWPIGEGVPEFAYAKWFEYAWFLMDIILLIQVGLYGKNSMPGTALAKHPWLSVIGVTTLTTLGMIAFVEWTGMKDGVTPAIMAVAIIACQFPIWLQERQQYLGINNEPDGISFWGIALRGVGDVTTAVSTWMVFLWVDGSDRPHAKSDDAIEALPYQLLHVPNDASDSYLASGDYQFALAPISANNPWTLFLMGAMIVCDFWVIFVLVRQRMRGQRMLSTLKARPVKGAAPS